MERSDVPCHFIFDPGSSDRQSWSLRFDPSSQRPTRAGLRVWTRSPTRSFVRILDTVDFGDVLPIKKQVASTRQDKIQFREVDGAKTSARVSVVLLTHVLVGLLTQVFAISTLVDISALQSNPLMYPLGDHSMRLPYFFGRAHHQKQRYLSSGRLSPHVYKGRKRTAPEL